jgi:uncharacterized protein
MIGTIVNAAAVIAGSAIGLVFRAKIPQRIITPVFQVIGLFTLFVGVSMALKTNYYLLLIGSMVIGIVSGTLLKLDDRVNKISGWVKQKLRTTNDQFTEGLVTAFLLYCMGAMTILGAFEEGMGNSPKLLLAKSLMDGISSIALSTALGSGVIFSALPLFLFQGSLTIAAGMLQQYLTTPLINEISAVGGLMLIGLGLNILEITKLKILDMIPALVFVVLFYFLFI